MNRVKNSSFLSDDDADDAEENRSSVVPRFDEEQEEQISILSRYISDAIHVVVSPTCLSQSDATVPLLQLYPHKRLQQYLLRSEVCTELPRLKRSANEDINALRTNFFRFKLVLLGDTDLVGGRHFAQLLSLERLQRVKSLLAQVDTFLGSPPRTVTTNRMDSEIIEFFDFKSCYSGRVAYGRANFVEVGVEVVIKSKQKTMTFDDCASIFFRRVLEDAHCLDKAEGVFCSSICIVPSFSPNVAAQKVHLAKMKDQRQHVLSLLKSAVVSEGSISLEFHFRAAAESGSDVENGELVCMRRFYRLSVVDTLDRTRCFSKFPMQALGVGLFRSLRDAQSFVKLFKNHLDAMRTKSTMISTEQAAATKEVAAVDAGDRDIFSSGSAAEASSSSTSSWMAWPSEVLRSFIDLMREGIQVHLNHGDLLAATEMMIQLNSLLVEQENKSGPANRDLTSSISLDQLKCISLSEAVHLRTTRDAVESLLACQEAFIVSVSQSYALQKKQKGLTLSEEERMDIVKLEGLFDLLAPAVVLVKRRVLALNNSISFSEFHYMYPYIVSMMWRLFEPTMMVRPLQAPEFFRSAKIGLYSVRNTILNSQMHLKELQGALHMLEVSICTEILMTMLNDDAIHMDSLRLQYEAIPGNFPRCISDLLGIVMNSSPTRKGDGGDEKLQKRTQKKQYFPINVSPRFRLQFLQNKSKVSDTVVAHDKDSPLVNELWEIYSELGDYDWVRLGGVDYRVGVKNELLAYDVPQCVSEEGFRIRYLTETLVLQSVQEAFITTTLSPTIIPHTSIANTSLFRCASLFQLLLLFPNARIQRNLFHPARDNLLLPCFSTSKKAPKYFSSATFSLNETPKDNQDLGYVEVAEDDEEDVQGEEESAFPYRLVGLSFRKGRFHFKKKSIRLGGGVIGVDRVLSALGRRGFDTLFRDAWMIPPMFLSPPLSPAVAAAIPSVTERHQMRVKMVSGLAVHSTLKKASKMEKISSLSDPDEGALSYDGVPDIEVLVKVDYDYNIAGNRARTVFAVILRACCEYMIRHSQHDWRLHSVKVPHRDEKNGGASQDKEFLFNDLCDEEKHPRLLFTMADRAALAGSAVVEASAAMLTPGSRPTLDELLEIFKSTVIGSEDDEEAVAVNKGDRKVEASVGKEDYSDSDDNEDSLDPCHMDLDRMCISSAVAQKLRRWIGSKNRIYVPCRIHFTLLAQQSIGKWNSSLPNAPRKAMESAVALSVGSDDTVARLVAGSLWFAHDASVILRDLMERSQLLWSRRGSLQKRNGAEAYFILLEAQNRQKAFQRCVNSGENAEAVHHAWVYALLTQNYSLATTIGRLGLGLAAFKLEQVLQYVASQERILESCSTQALSSEEMRTMAFTASYISQAIRFHFGSPQMVHLRGGCCHILQCLALLDELWGLSSSANDENHEDEVPNNYKGGEEKRYRPSKRSMAAVNPPDRAADENGAEISKRSSLNARKAFTSPENIAAVTSLLHRVQTLLKPLIFALVKDCLCGFPDIETSLAGDQVVMVDTLKVAAVVLDNHCDLAAIHSFYRRAQSTTHHLLASKAFLTMLRDKFEHIKAVSHHTTEEASIVAGARSMKPAEVIAPSQSGPGQSSATPSKPSENLAAANLISTLSAELGTMRRQREEDGKDNEDEVDNGKEKEMIENAALSGQVEEEEPSPKDEKAALSANGRNRRRWQELEPIDEQETREDSDHIAFPKSPQPTNLSNSYRTIAASSESRSPIAKFSPATSIPNRESSRVSVHRSAAMKFRSQSMLNNLRAYGGVAMNMQGFDEAPTNQKNGMLEGHSKYDEDEEEEDDEDEDDDDDGGEEEEDSEVDQQDDENSMLFALRNMTTATKYY